MNRRAAILVVEDDADIRMALADVLLEEGYQVRVAANGAEGLTELSRDPKPQLVLLDLMMPVLNGWQFRKAQQANEQLAHIPVVIVSADATAHKQASEIGAAAFLQKPVELDELLSTVERYALVPTP